MLKAMILKEDYVEVDEMHARFLEKQRNRSAAQAAARPVVQEVDQDAGSSEDEDEDTQMGDTEMGEAPVVERAEPVVDEDGFELVQKKGGRRR